MSDYFVAFNTNLVRVLLLNGTNFLKIEESLTIAFELDRFRPLLSSVCCSYSRKKWEDPTNSLSYILQHVSRDIRGPVTFETWLHFILIQLNNSLLDLIKLR